MSTEILVNIGPQETRVALVEGGAAQEIHVQRASRHGLTGNVYKGRVQRVLPGMQAAFVDVGLERTAFLHVADMLPGPGGAATEGGAPQITQLLHEGQAVLVQILKDPLGTKGARLTTLLSIPSRYLVMLPFEPNVGVSARIEDEVERERLKGILSDIQQRLAPRFGVIARTAAENTDAAALENDLAFLMRLWDSISEQSRDAAAGTLVHGDLPLSMRILRDLLGTDVERIRIDDAEEFERVRQFARVFVPLAADRLELYEGAAPIFDLYGVEDDITRALARKVDLKSGGHLIIDQTEAMTTIDINTGAFVGHRNLEETIFKTNLEAAAALARQLRLRNLGGIIIIDFIDMKDAEHRRQVLRALERAMEKDYAKTSITGVSELGLVEMTRKRTRESLEHVLCETCHYCHGRGSLKSPETVCYEVFREILREARAYESNSLLVLASQEVVDRLLDEESASVADLEEFIGASIQFQVEAMYTQEQFDVILL